MISQSFQLTHKRLSMNGAKFMWRYTHTHGTVIIQKHSFRTERAACICHVQSTRYLRAIFSRKTEMMLSSLLRAIKIFWSDARMPSLLEFIVSHILTTERCRMSTHRFIIR